MTDALPDCKELAAQLRVDSIRCTTAAGSGHPTSSLSAADLMAVLLSKYLRFDWSNPRHPNNDRLIFSKGHACPLLYAMFKAVGAITDSELLRLRKKGSPLEGHPNPHTLPLVDVATGSLGQGLPIGVGMALNGKYLDHLPYRVWVLLGDSETAEGSIWEGFDKGWYYKLDNLIAILDMNRLGQRGETELAWHSEKYAARIRAFGWRAIELNGHDLQAIDRAYSEALTSKGQPTCLIARTVKGEGVSFLANKDGWHGKALNPEQMQQALAGTGRRTPPGHQDPPAREPGSAGRDHQPAAQAADLHRRRQGGDPQGLRRRPHRTGRPFSRPGRPRCRGVQLDPRR